MERHWLHGTVAAHFARPDPDLVARLGRHDAAKVADSMAGHGVAHHEIKPLRRQMRLCGPALTVVARPGDALYVQRAIELVQPGDVVVIDAAGYCDVAVIGERLASFMKWAGAAGIVVDGAVRDSLGIVAEGPPTFCRSVCIRIFGSRGPGAIGVSIQCGGVDVALMAHGHSLHLGGRPAMGRKSVVVEYRGRSAHASSAPEQAVNALDAVVLLFSSVGLMRQQLRGEARVHGIITHGGEAANIIPEYTRAEFYVRSCDMAYLEELEERLLACARGAAQATGTTLEVSAAALTMLPVRRLALLESTYEDAVRRLGHAVGVARPEEGTGSTDFGNVSQVVPALHAYFSVGPGEWRCHTHAFAEAARSPSGLEGMVVAAHAMALTALRLIHEPELLARVRAEFASADHPEVRA
ncbi:MAG: peptidase dimerization domain-containing protein [Candidatus Latescibacterota bacterium]